MNENNENSSGLKPISLRKSDYPEIYGKKEPEITLPETEEIYPAKRMNESGKKALPAENASKPGIKSSSGPVYQKIIDNGAFIDYLLGTETVQWYCRGSASAKKGLSKILPFSAALMLTGLLLFFICLSKRDFVGVLLGVLLAFPGMLGIEKYLKGGYDTHFAVTDERVIFLCGKEIKTEYLYKIEKAEVIPAGKKTSDIKLYISDGDITLIEGLSADKAAQIPSVIAAQKKQKGGR